MFLFMKEKLQHENGYKPALPEEKIANGLCCTMLKRWVIWIGVSLVQVSWVLCVQKYSIIAEVPQEFLECRNSKETNAWIY